ncbi:MAG TPA: TetR/AcrR family transcriptional regulator [Actinopolymorphaceae bacterium]
MGHKEQLLEAAKRCLYEIGYAHITARDLVAASGTNLASIGYHYGSKDALLNAAMISATVDWGEQLGQALAASAADEGAAAEGSGGDRLERLWSRVLDLFAAHRPVLVANFEAFPHAERSAELRRQLAVGQEEARRALAAMVLDVEEDALDEPTVREVGSVVLAMLTGLMVQWLVAPEKTPSARRLADGLRRLAAVPGGGDERSAE